MKWVKQQPVDLFYERATRSSLAGTFASRWLGMPLVAEVNDLAVHPRTLDQASAIVVPEPRSLDVRFRSKCHVLPWGVDTRRINPSVDAQCVQSRFALHGKPTVVFMSSFLPWHGAQALVRAAPLIVRRFPSVRFLMIGTGPDEDAIRREVSRLSLDTHFVFTGLVPHTEVSGYLVAGSVAVAPYSDDLGMEKGRAEMACSLKVLEYMAAGKPVVVAEVGNRNGAIEHGVTGLVIRHAEPEPIAHAICQLLEDPNLASEMGRRGRAVVEEKYSWQLHAKELATILDTVVRVANENPNRH